MIFLKNTLIHVTHSNIFAFDISNKFYNLSSQIYKTFCYHNIVIHSFGKIFRVLIILGYIFHHIDKLLRFL